MELFFGSRRYESEVMRENCDVHFKFSMSTVTGRVVRFHRNKREMRGRKR